MHLSKTCYQCIVNPTACQQSLLHTPQSQIAWDNFIGLGTVCLHILASAANNAAIGFRSVISKPSKFSASSGNRPEAIHNKFVESLDVVTNVADRQHRCCPAELSVALVEEGVDSIDRLFEGSPTILDGPLLNFFLEGFDAVFPQ